MTQPLYFRKELGKLAPADDAAQAALAKIKFGAEVQVEIKRPRNIQFHRKFFAMLNLVYENQEHYPSVDALLTVCKIATGHSEAIKTKFGIVYLPKSISFAKMTAHEFDEFYGRAVSWVIEEVIPGLERSQLDSEVAEKLSRFGD